MSESSPVYSPGPAAPAAATESSTEQLNNGERAEGTPAKETKPKVAPKQMVDFGDEKVDLDTLKTERSKYKAAESKFREAAQARKEVESFYEALQNDPEAVLNDPRLSLKKRELAEKWLMEELQASLSEPIDQRDVEMANIKKELEKYQNQEKQTKEQKEQEEYQTLVNSRKEAIATTLSKAMEHSPLSQDPATATETLREMAIYMRLCRDAGYEASPEEIAQHVESRYTKSYSQLANKLDGDQLIQFLGEQVVQKIRKADLQRLQKQREQPAPQQSDNWQSNNNNGPKREIVDPNDFRRKR
jgi:hypothetical protein